jgi:hypothetical protein
MGNNLYTAAMIVLDARNLAAVYRLLPHPHTAKEIGYGIADRDVEQPFFRVQRRSYPNPASTAGCIIRAVPSVETGFTLAGDRIKSPYWFAIG